MDVKRIAEKWEIWNEEKEAARSEKEEKRLVPKYFHKLIHVFGNKASKRMPARKLWDHAINMKEIFVPRKRKVYLLSREERKEAPVFFVGKKDGKKHMV